MAYNSTTGSLHVGDLLNEDDEDTQIDFGYDSIIFRTNRLPRFHITNTSVSASGPVSGSEFRAEVSLSSSRGVTGSSLQVGAYGWTNDGRVAINTLTLGGTALTSTAAELNKLDGADSNVTAAKLSTLSALSDTEIGYIDGSSAGSAVASKAVVYDAQKGITAQSVTGSVLSASYNLLTANLTASQGLKVSKDNQYIRIGAGEDLLLYHDSANSVIKNQTGHLIIDSNATDKHIRLKLGENDSTTQVQVRNNSDSTVLKIGADGALSASSGLSGSSLIVGTATKYGLHWDGGLAISKMNTNWTNAGRTIADLGIATTVDLRGGAIDGTTVGATNQSTGQFTSLSSSTLETARGATLGKNTGDRTRITGSFSVSGSVMGHQFFPTRHAYNTTATTMKFIPFYNLSEANAPNNATYINEMIVPFSGQLKRVYYRPSGSQNGNVSIALFKATNGNGDINMNEQGTLIETQVVSCPNAVSTTTVFNFTGSNHYSAGDVVGVSVHPNANQVEVHLVCLWEYNVYGL